MKAKFLIAIVLIGSILFTGCAQSVGTTVDPSKSEATTVPSKSESIVLGTEAVPSASASETTTALSATATGNFQTTIDPSEYDGPSDKNFLQYVKDATYAEAVKTLNGTEYIV